jgi:multimeric flavodoxin WrbA
MTIKEEIDRIRYMMNVLTESDDNTPNTIEFKKLKVTIDELKKKDKVLLLSCSNRYQFDPKKPDVPKSKLLSLFIKEELGDKATFIDVTELKILPCEGNVSRSEGNSCGLLKAMLKDKDKNPSGFHRCWVNINEPSDELWKISRELFESDVVLFFSSVRWGQANMYYQNLIERLTWIQNRHTTLGESNIIKDIETGYICTGQNWNGINVVDTQKEVHNYYGFKPNNKLYWNWQYTENPNDETQKSYKASGKKFLNDMGISESFLEEEKKEIKDGK